MSLASLLPPVAEGGFTRQHWMMRSTFLVPFAMLTHPTKVGESPVALRNCKLNSKTRRLMGVLTTHVLDTSSGKPGNGIRLDLYRIEGERHQLLSSVTNQDGRCEEPLLQGKDFSVGVYELVFHAGEYFDRSPPTAAQPRFLDQVVIRFGVADAGQHYHVPLLISPFGYSTYRGS
jgi:5-hydroxyisourate hydrolase